MQFQRMIDVRTRGRGLVDLTREVAACVRDSHVTSGLAVLFCRHTSASLVITENADPSARGDLLDWLERIAPDGDPRNVHDAEGPDDSPAHQRSALLRTSETIPIAGGALVLGTWQGIFLAEHRHAAHARSVLVHISGE
jgi:secondary thiamine-phosphate synthase enzyme